MNKKIVTCAVSGMILLGLAPMSWAITFGEPDGNAHPQVGAMMPPPLTVLLRMMFLSLLTKFMMKTPRCTKARIISTPTTVMIDMI
jgi:hypothetical protein